MGLFDKKPGYKDVVLYLSHIPEAEYKKLLRVVRIYRGAEKTVKSVLGGNLADYVLEYEEVGELPKVGKKK